MKKILFIAAEPTEIACAQTTYQAYKKRLTGKVDVHFLLGGIGVHSTAYTLTKRLLEERATAHPFDLVINIGIAGSYDTLAFPIGTAAVISKDFFADLGAEDTTGTVFEDNFVPRDKWPYQGSALPLAPLTDATLLQAIAPYKRVVGVTVQTISGNPQKIERIRAAFQPAIESMEGAAVHYVCLMEKTPFVALRSVSNRVGDRDKQKWDIPAARRALSAGCEQIFRAYAQSLRI